MADHDERVDPGPWPGSPASAAAHVAVGGVCGLTWAAALRAWMVQLVGADGSTFSWLTIALVLAPGLLVGLLLGWAAYLRGTGARMPRWLPAAPALFAMALLDPTIFMALISTGEGAGALMVVATSLAAGFALSRRGWSLARSAAGLVAVLGLSMLGAIGTMAGPVTTPRGAWVCLLGLSLMLLLCLAAALPYRAAHAPRGVGSFVAVGALAGFAWAASLRAFMAQVVGAESTVHWVNTFAYILLPGAVAGSLLGLAEHWRRTGGQRHWRWLTLAPFLFAAVLVQGVIEDPSSMFADGVGAGTVAVPLLGIIGGHALSGHGPVWSRSLAGVVGASTLVVWAFVGTVVGGPTFAVTTPHGIWALVLYDGLLVTLALAASVPQRAPTPVPSGSGSPARRPRPHPMKRARRALAPSRG